jgi:hypothetical protein
VRELLTRLPAKFNRHSKYTKHIRTVGDRNSFSRSFPCGLVGRRRKARSGPFSA